MPMTHAQAVRAGKKAAATRRRNAGKQGKVKPKPRAGSRKQSRKPAKSRGKAGKMRRARQAAINAGWTPFTKMNKKQHTAFVNALHS